MRKKTHKSDSVRDATERVLGVSMLAVGGGIGAGATSASEKSLAATNLPASKMMGVATFGIAGGVAAGSARTLFGKKRMKF